MKDPRSTVRYLGFLCLSDGGRRFNFSFADADAALQTVSIEAPPHLFSGPDRMAIQECAGICYETIKSRVTGRTKAVPHSLSLTPDDVALHRKPTKHIGRRSKVAVLRKI